MNNSKSNQKKSLNDLLLTSEKSSNLMQADDPIKTAQSAINAVGKPLNDMISTAVHTSWVNTMIPKVKPYGIKHSVNVQN